MPSKPPVKQGEPPIRPIDYTVNDNGCWVWNWSVSEKGYAAVQLSGRAHRAHRVAYELVNGPIPDGLMIRHLCGNPSCVNAEHLIPGTQTQNSIDMVDAGNQVTQKLRRTDADKIRQIFAAGGISRSEIARQYGVTPGTIRLIIANKTFQDEYYSPPSMRKKKSVFSVLDNELAKEIRKIYARGGISQQAVAEMYQVSHSTISSIIRNKLYSDLDYIVPVRRASNQKLTKEQVGQISDEYRSGTSQGKLAIKYGISQSAISMIVSGKVHHGRQRIYPTEQRKEQEPRPTLKSLHGPAPTSKEEQKRRQQVHLPNRKPNRKPGDPLITENYWYLVPDTGCHNWRWGKNSSGHGFITALDGKRVMAYRAAWEMQYGPIPAGVQMNHRCNNGLCINVDHLYQGDQFDNMQDTVSAGNHATQKLSRKDVKEIRQQYEPGNITYQKLADEYGVTIGTIYSVINNKSFHDPYYVPKNTKINVRRTLSESDSSLIRQKYIKEKKTQRSIAKEYSVSRSVIKGIINNTTYYDPEYFPPSPDEKRLWKLSPNDIESIKREYIPRKVTHNDLAAKYGVTSKTIKGILRNNGSST